MLKILPKSQGITKNAIPLWIVIVCCYWLLTWNMDTTGTSLNQWADVAVRPAPVDNLTVVDRNTTCLSLQWQHGKGEDRTILYTLQVRLGSQLQVMHPGYIRGSSCHGDIFNPTKTKLKPFSTSFWNFVYTHGMCWNSAFCYSGIKTIY